MDMMDIADTVAPNSDQLNAEDLLTGPRTFTIEKVVVKGGDQPVDIHLVGAEGRPWRPSKTMRRILVAAWGEKSAGYVGKSVTLYRDPSIKFGGQAVGGICVSHMSDIGKALELALTETRGKRKLHKVSPLTQYATAPAPSGPDELRRQLWEALGSSRPAWDEVAAQWLRDYAEDITKTADVEGLRALLAKMGDRA